MPAGAAGTQRALRIPEALDMPVAGEHTPEAEVDILVAGAGTAEEPDTAEEVHHTWAEPAGRTVVLQALVPSGEDRSSRWAAAEAERTVAHRPGWPVRQDWNWNPYDTD